MGSGSSGSASHMSSTSRVAVNAGAVMPRSTRGDHRRSSTRDEQLELDGCFPDVEHRAAARGVERGRGLVHDSAGADVQPAVQRVDVQLAVELTTAANHDAEIIPCAFVGHDAQCGQRSVLRSDVLGAQHIGGDEIEQRQIVRHRSAPPLFFTLDLMHFCRCSGCYRTPGDLYSNLVCVSSA